MVPTKQSRELYHSIMYLQHHWCSLYRKKRWIALQSFEIDLYAPSVTWQQNIYLYSATYGLCAHLQYSKHYSISYSQGHMFGSYTQAVPSWSKQLAHLFPLSADVLSPPRAFYTPQHFQWFCELLAWILFFTISCIGVSLGKAIFLDDVIYNLTRQSNHYKEAVLTYVVGKSQHASLYANLVAANAIA